MKNVNEPRTTTEIREAIKELWEEHHKKVRVLEDELKVALKLKQDNCKHPEDKIRIRTDSYFEPGKMRSPVEWREKYCKHCGKVVATSSTESREIWTTTK